MQVYQLFCLSSKQYNQYEASKLDSCQLALPRISSRSKDGIVIIRNSDACLTISSFFCLGLKTTKLDFLTLIVIVLAFSQSQTFFSSVLTTVSRDFKALSAYNNFVSPTNR